MPGTQIFTYANIGKETTRGTPVAPTRQFYADGTGVLTEDLGLNFHQAENSGVRTRVRRVTQTSEDVALDMKTISGVGYDDLIIPFSQLAGGAAAVGAGADKTWTQTPSMTAANNPLAFSLDVGDDIQNWRCQYGMFNKIKLSANRQDGLTQLAMSGFAQRAVKVAKATPAMNSAVKIPAELWTVKFASTLAGLPGASVQTNFLIDWDIEVDTGILWRHYMDGNLYGGQHVETDIAVKFSMVTEMTTLAISEFYDKWKAQTMDFVRLKATGPTLGGSTYSSQIDLPILYSKVRPIGDQSDGVNLCQVEANLAYDATSATSLNLVTVNSMTAMP